MELTINGEITDQYILREGYIFRDGFVFTLGQDYPPIYNRLVIRSPQRARADDPRVGYSHRTLEEHLDLINQYQIEKVRIICDNLDFIQNCPSLRDIIVYPSYGAPANFDYSVLYQMPNLKCVSCRTNYGECGQFKTTVDYSQIKGLEEIALIGDGHIGYETVPTLKKIWISENRKIRNFSEISNSKVLEDVTLLQCGIQSLSGLEKCPKLKSLTFYNNRLLTDISALESIGQTLEEFTIESCSKVQDFSALKYLVNLRILDLLGNNVLHDLSFLSCMKKLIFFSVTMNVEDGNLSHCKHIPYVTCRNRKHYNLKDKDLPKDLRQVQKYRGVII